MLRIIEKPSPLMQKALEHLKKGAKIGENLAQKSLKNGNADIIFAEKCENLFALDKIINTANKSYKTRFIYDGEKLKRWTIIENTPAGKIKHKVLNSPQKSSGEMYLDGTLYNFSGIITNPKNIVKYGKGQRISQEKFLQAVNYIRNAVCSVH